MSAKNRLLEKYPEAKVVSDRYRVDQDSFDRQRSKLERKRSEGGAIGVIWLNPDTLVLTRRTGLHPGWALLGGTVEKDEDFDVTFVREAKEEAGLDITIKRLAMLEQKLLISPSGDELNMDLAVFEATANDGQVIQSTQEAIVEGIEVVVFGVDSLPTEMILRDSDKLRGILSSA